MNRLICWLFGHSIKNYRPQIIGYKVDWESWDYCNCARCGARFKVP